MSKRWNENQASQFIEAPIQRLATFGGSTGAPANAQFRVPIIDPRLRTFLGLEFVPPAGANLTTVATALAATATLWLYEEQEDRSGVSGVILPLTNLQNSTKAAPISIPLAGLFGFAIEIVSISQFVGGVFQAAGGPAGTWNLDVIYKPESGATFSFSEWEQLTSMANPVVIVGPDTIP